MQKILQYILPFELSQGIPDSAIYSLYNEWDRPSRQTQIASVTFLTALLYIAFLFIDKPWASADVQLLMAKFHLLIVVPLLLTISYLAYKKFFYQFTLYCLAVFPLISMSGHVYIASQLSNSALFLTEGYIGVLWIFIVSGLNFRFSLGSAVFTSAILIVPGFYFIHPIEVFALHVFWILCSFSFGFMGALIADKTRKAIFLSQQENHQLAITDPLTGVFNRNKLNQMFAKEVARDHRYQQGFAMLMVDIDHFKDINDKFGHDIGDQILKQISLILSKSIRDNDILVRWGGEEFVILALQVPEYNLVDFCDKIRREIAEHCFDIVDQITVSVGATVFSKDDSQESIFKRADKALYLAKNKGRNTVVII